MFWNIDSYFVLGGFKKNMEQNMELYFMVDGEKYIRRCHDAK